MPPRVRYDVGHADSCQPKTQEQSERRLQRQWKSSRTRLASAMLLNHLQREAWLLQLSTNQRKRLGRATALVETQDFCSWQLASEKDWLMRLLNRKKLGSKVPVKGTLVLAQEEPFKLCSVQLKMWINRLPERLCMYIATAVSVTKFGIVTSASLKDWSNT